jgi:aspartyl protease family protein
MSRMLVVALVAIGVVLVLLIANHDSGQTFGLQNEAFANIFYMSLWGLVLASGIVMSRIAIAQAVRSLAIWGVIAVALVGGYQFRYELQDFASAVTAGLVPGSPMSRTDADGLAMVQVERAVNGHFEVRARLNGQTVSMLVDTGASTTVLSAEDATRAGIDVASLRFVLPVSTANGRGMAARAEITQLLVGDIERSNSAVLVAQPGALNQSLLGMSFLNSLTGFDVRGDRLILHP